MKEAVALTFKLFNDRLAALSQTKLVVNRRPDVTAMEPPGLTGV
jgi:hypothetical protein